MIKVMLDTNVFGRPYDDISQDRIFREAILSVSIFRWALQGKIRLLGSDALIAEINLIRDEAKKEIILNLVKGLCSDNVAFIERAALVADGVYEYIADFMDALHIALCAIGSCDYFVTCDDEITKKAFLIEKYLITNGYNVKIRNPESFIEELQ